MEKKVVIKYVRTSPKKLREIIDQVKGKRAVDIMPVLKTSVKKAAHNMVYKAVKSAMHLFDKSLHNEVIVKNVIANGGPKFKRFRPGSKGMAHPYARRTSHLEVIVTLPAAKAAIKPSVKKEEVKKEVVKTEKKDTKVVKKTVKK